MMAEGLPDWPTVPACYGWLSLDARGQWRLKDEVIRHPGLLAFLNTNYTSDAAGCWLVNNGPQRVYVRLESAPWVLRLEADGRLHTHTGRSVELIGPLLLDAAGRIFMPTDAGPAALDDRDLAGLLAEIQDTNGKPASEEALDALLSTCNEGAEGIAPAATADPALNALRWRGLPLISIGTGLAAARLGFIPEPTPAAPGNS